MPQTRRRRQRGDRLKGQFLFLLASLLFLMAIAPFFHSYVQASIITSIFLTAILVSTIYAISPHKKQAATALILGVPMLAVMWTQFFADLPLSLTITGKFFAILFVGYTTLSIFSFMMRQAAVTKDVIHAALVVYLLLGLMWSFIYSALELAAPGSFHHGGGQTGESRTPFIYYSFVTLTTLGYGDITPVTDKAQSLSILEAILGQMYLIFQVSWLVGRYTAQSSKS